MTLRQRIIHIGRCIKAIPRMIQNKIDEVYWLPLLDRIMDKWEMTPGYKGFAWHMGQQIELDKK